jgi:hypothetical protein
MAKTQEECFSQKWQALEKHVWVADWEISWLTGELSTSRASLEAMTVAQGAAAAEVLRLREQVEPLEVRVRPSRRAPRSSGTRLSTRP